METSIIELILGPGGLLVALIFAFVAGLKKKWVFGWMYEEKDQEVKEWKEAALRGTRVAERAVTIHERELDHASRSQEG